MLEAERFDRQAGLRLARETNDPLFGESFPHARAPDYVIGRQSVVLARAGDVDVQEDDLSSSRTSYLFSSTNFNRSRKYRTNACTFGAGTRSFGYSAFNS